MGYDGGQFCLDTNGAIFVRYGTTILRGSALVEFDGMLVMGVGNGFPCLVFFDKSRYQEKGLIDGGGGTAANNTIASEWASKVYGLDDDRRKKLTRVEVKYYNDHTYQSGSNSGFKFYYRADNAVNTSRTDVVTGAYLPDYTELTNVSKTLSATEADRDRTHVMRVPIELDLEGITWQFKITSDYNFRILGFKPFLKPIPEMEDE